MIRGDLINLNEILSEKEKYRFTGTHKCLLYVRNGPCILALSFLVAKIKMRTRPIHFFHLVNETAVHLITQAESLDIAHPLFSWLVVSASLHLSSYAMSSVPWNCHRPRSEPSFLIITSK